MQRKRRKYNTGRIKHYLHSIPKLLLITKLKDNNLNTHNDNSCNNSIKNVKSNVLYSIPSVNKSNTDYSSKSSTYYSTNGIRWTSPHRASITSLLSNTISTNRIRSSRNTIPYSRIARWGNLVLSTISLVLLFGLFSLCGLLSLLLHSALYSNSCYAASTASIEIVTPELATTATAGTTTYVSSNVVYSASNITNYSIKLSYAEGYDSLKLENSTNSLPDINNNSSSNDNNNDNTSSDSNNGILGSSITNAWGYAWSNTNTDDSSLYYKAVPAYSNPATIESNNVTNSSLPNTTKKMVFAANFSDSMVAGHYQTKVMLSMVATPKATVYTLTLDNNGGTGGTTSKTCETYDSSCSISLSDIVVPSRTNYTFLGWNDSSSATTAQYTKTSTITVSANKTIYAVWTFDENSVTGFGGIKKMQDMTASACGNSAMNATGQLYDSRDNSIYSVIHAKDGQCWMTSNLRLSAPEGGRILTSSDSNVSSNWTMPATFTDDNLGNNTGDICSKNFYHGGSYVSGDNSKCFKKAQSYIYNNTGYYNWAAATANSGDELSTTGATATYSICPKGWRLPRGGLATSGYNLNDYYRLFVVSLNPSLAPSTLTDSWSYLKASASVNIENSPYNFIGDTGEVGSGRLSLDGAGRWWTKTAVTTNAYFLIINSQSVIPATTFGPGSNRMYGYAIRCILENGSSSGIPDDF